jgi:tetratricopeptide (TPR) repeat protein
VGVIAVIAGAGFIAFTLRQREEQAATEAREQRQEAWAEVAPAPLPSGWPLHGEEGADADGTPRQAVDLAGVRSLLLNRRFSELDAAFAHFQDAFEADQRFESWPIDAARAFESSEMPVREAIEAWVKVSPRSFAPYLASGASGIAQAQAQRDVKWAADTDARDLAQMEATLHTALADLHQALTLRPSLDAALREELRAYRLLGDGAHLWETIAKADQACPACFEHRVSVMYALLPRWGGSYDEMRAYLARLPVQVNPRLRLLEGFIDVDQSDVAMGAGRHAEALAAMERACARGDYAPFLVERAAVRRHRGEFAEALRDLNRALERSPSSAEAYFGRAELRFRQKAFEQAGEDLLAGFRLNPTEHTGRQLYTPLTIGVVDEGWSLFEEGRDEDALRVLDLAAQIAPVASDVLQKRAAVLAAHPPSPRELAILKERVEASPDDLFSRRRLDYSLFKLGRYEEIVSMWTKYLEHHDDGRAYMERAGTYSHLKRFPERDRDLRKACERGISEGCPWVR